MADDKAAEATPENVTSEMAEEKKTDTEIKEEKTPETPVTEPLTNGSSTPEEPKAATPAQEEPVPVATNVTEEVSPATPEPPKIEPKNDTEPEQLPVNGLVLEDNSEPAKIEDSKPELPAAETTEAAPEPEIHVKNEESLPMSDKLADLIPEVPVVPEFKTTDTEITTDVAVAN